MSVRRNWLDRIEEPRSIWMKEHADASTGTRRHAGRLRRVLTSRRRDSKRSLRCSCSACSRETRSPAVASVLPCIILRDRAFTLGAPNDPPVKPVEGERLPSARPLAPPRLVFAVHAGLLPPPPMLPPVREDAIHTSPGVTPLAGRPARRADPPTLGSRKSRPRRGGEESLRSDDCETAFAVGTRPVWSR